MNGDKRIKLSKEKLEEWKPYQFDSVPYKIEINEHDPYLNKIHMWYDDIENETLISMEKQKWRKI